MENWTLPLQGIFSGLPAASWTRSSCLSSPVNSIDVHINQWAQKCQNFGHGCDLSTKTDEPVPLNICRWAGIHIQHFNGWFFSLSSISDRLLLQPTAVSVLLNQWFTRRSPLKPSIYYLCLTRTRSTLSTTTTAL